MLVFDKCRDEATVSFCSSGYPELENGRYADDKDQIIETQG